MTGSGFKTAESRAVRDENIAKVRLEKPGSPPEFVPTVNGKFYLIPQEAPGRDVLVESDPSTTARSGQCEFCRVAMCQREPTSTRFNALLLCRESNHRFIPFALLARFGPSGFVFVQIQNSSSRRRTLLRRCSGDPKTPCAEQDGKNRPYKMIITRCRLRGTSGRIFPPRRSLAVPVRETCVLAGEKVLFSGTIKNTRQ